MSERRVGGEEPAGISRKQQHRAQKDDSMVGFWKSILLAIPKNLVYIFVGIVFFAFAAMCYITYTERDLKQFLRYERGEEVIIVDPLFTSLKQSMISELDKNQPIEMPIHKFANKTFFDDFLSESRPLVVREYAKKWPAMSKWSSKTYMSENAGNTVVRLQAFTKHPWSDFIKKNKEEGEKNTEPVDDLKEGEFSAHFQKSTSSLQSIQTALERIQNNGQEKDRISFLDFEILKPSSPLKKDTMYPVLHEFLPFQSLYLSIWPKFEHKPAMLQGESWHCVVDGSEKIRLVSPVFSQNLYQNVYEDVAPQHLPEALDLFKIDEDMFPLMEEVREYILETTLQKGDCVFVPSLHWFQYETQGKESTIVAFEYQPSSKYVDLFFKAINQGLHKE